MNVCGEDRQKRMPFASITLLIDAKCPLCAMEMRHLKRCDQQGRIALVDIHSDEFQQCFPEVALARASAVLHGQLSDGTWLYGLDATHHAWSLVGLGHRTAWLRCSVLRQVADAAYRMFAKHRRTLSSFVPKRFRVEVCDLCVKRRS